MEATEGEEEAGSHSGSEGADGRRQRVGSPSSIANVGGDTRGVVRWRCTWCRWLRGGRAGGRVMCFVKRVEVGWVIESKIERSIEK